MKRPLLNIDHLALCENYLRLKRRCPEECAATVKADAYGLGAEEVTATLAAAGCQIFFVATLEEAIRLRKHQESAKIYVFEGFDDAFRKEFEETEIRPVLNSKIQIQSWARTQPHLPAALHIDSGMNRLGVSLSEFEELMANHSSAIHENIDLLMTHLAFADRPDHPGNNRQLVLFKSAIDRLPDLNTSIGNSAGVLNGAEYCGHIARPGIGIYGGNPWSNKPSPMRPVVRLEAPILQIREVSPGDTVGYSGTFQADTSMTLATVGIGYADGIPRCISTDAFMRVGDTRCPIVGRISMDTTIIDVSCVPEKALRSAEYAEVIGETSVDEFADWTGTISYEVLTNLGPRIVRSHAHVKSELGQSTPHASSSSSRTASFAVAADCR